jgi:beta-glucuronidase
VFEARPELWSPKNPRLYDVVLRCGTDRVDDRVGFRQVAVHNGRLELNGEPLFLRGVAMHEDSHERGRGLTDRDRQARVDLALELGCNFLRLAHYPHHENMARLADEQGLLLWEELPVYWSVAFERQDVYQNTERQLRELIKRDRNRASVVLWSVGNENPDTDMRLEFMRSLVSTAREETPDRLVTAACLVDLNEDRVNDRLADELDVISVNEYYGWYYARTDRLRKLLSQPLPKPLTASEFGAAAVAGRSGSDTEYWTEEMQARVFEEQLQIMREFPHVCGAIPWILFDFRTPRRTNALQRMHNRKGLVDETLTRKKLAFHSVARIYRDMRNDEEC